MRSVLTVVKLNMTQMTGASLIASTVIKVMQRIIRIVVSYLDTKISVGKQEMFTDMIPVSIDSNPFELSSEDFPSINISKKSKNDYLSSSLNSLNTIPAISAPSQPLISFTHRKRSSESNPISRPSSNVDKYI